MTLHGRDITVEVRSVNNRYLDVSVKMPRNFIFAEDAVKAMVQRYTSRGKVDVFVTVNTLGAEETVVAVNEALAKSYIDALRHLRQLGGYGMVKELCYVTDLARLPDVLTVTKGEEDLETVSADLCAVLEEALAAYTAMRETEGRRLAEDIGRRLDAIEALTQLVEARSPQTVAEYREKLLSRMREVLQSTSIDEARILTEAAEQALDGKEFVNEFTRNHFVAELKKAIADPANKGKGAAKLFEEMTKDLDGIFRNPQLEKLKIHSVDHNGFGNVTVEHMISAAFKPKT